MSACGHREFGVRMVLHYLVNDAPVKQPKGAKAPKKPVVSNKQEIAKFQFLHKLLVNFNFSNDQLITAAKFAQKGANHTSNDVRIPAYDCMGELYRIMGPDELAPYYDGLRKAQLDALMAKFAEIDESNGVPTKQPKKDPPPRKETIETNIGKKPAAN